MAKSITGEVLQGPVTKEGSEVKPVDTGETLEVPDFEKIERSEGFKNLMRKKKLFLIPATALFLGLYLAFNIVISYTNWLDTPIAGDIPWVWVFAFGLFAMTWILVTVYMKRAARFDKMAEETLREFGYEEKGDI
ncbi:DUF485 domain-containing protein [Planomicrobium sp. Y74]|uniref:DUF485 domain-containing protein n=1 Tax=Planomicrobium sp. Y74 TaxID=2478977 RepID=UPI000EF4F335|nr:DUF485 domain-containing protein [Planomicrobium sp. Y74]RLQ90915.1 DUF485 domain-containing protein [Planomicrobium sp. Y74]